jgi:signal transduction histidine kinase
MPDDRVPSPLASGETFVARPVDHLSSPQRLASIARLGLGSAVRDAVFDRASRLATHLLGAEVALVSIVTDEHQLFAGASGLEHLDAEVAQSRATELRLSLCQSVVSSQELLAINHGSNDERFRDHPAVTELGIEAYLGVPVRDAGGSTLGSFCVLQRVPRDWTDDDIEQLELLGGFVRSELLLRDQLEQVTHLARMRDDLTRSAAHDLRASIAAISGATRTLAAGRGSDPTVQAELLDVAVRQSARTERLLETFLQQPHDQRRPQPFALDEVVRASAQAAAADGASHGRLRLLLEPVEVRSYPELVERSVLNLIRNALQHTTGGVEVRSGRDGELAIVVVRDHGPGLPVWLQQGQLGDAALQGRAAGHGIGIFSAVTLARSIGGDITFETDSTGTSFRVLLPLEPGMAPLD